MKHYLPADELQFLMELSIEPVAVKLGLVEPPSPTDHGPGASR
jgi:hypothetical protein